MAQPEAVPTMTEKQRILMETTEARDEAEAVLAVLIEARGASERHLLQMHKPDVLKQVTGRSSMDNAIASTQRMIETLNRVIQDVKRDLNDDELDLLDPDGPGL